ncbi:MAG TPA: hypothetical protein VHI71_11940 [Actinomycetota bacterium]|nr:hypothetical protein [Actinomycetota bacterium]
MSEVSRKASTVLVGALLAATLFMAYTIGNSASATHQPADKVAATASDLDELEGDGEAVLSETMRVSSPADLILQVTAECSILTELTTGPAGPTAGGASDSAFAFGSVRFHVEIDGIPVPVGTDESATSEDDLEDNDEDGNEVGEVTFCNRAYERTVTDGENQPDGLDEEHDFIRTRTANAFNWFALDAGETYDVDGDNVITIEVIADYDTDTAGDAVADAFVGSRSLIVEPVHAANDELVGPGPAEGSPRPSPSGSCTPQGNGNNCK